MIDYAGIIKARVTVPEAVNRYTTQRIVRNRIKCPVHNGTDYNMRIYRDTYYCWVCHATGDVIQFVMSVTGDTFRAAMERINRDFALGLPLDRSERTEADWKAVDKARREAAIRRVQQMFDDADALIDGTRKANTAGLLHDTDLIIKRYRPYNGWSKWRKDWCEALRLRELLNEQIR
jgi:DNA primase